MTARSLPVLLLGLTLLSCAHRSRLAAPQPAVHTVMRRQIQNAVDAGVGDYRVRVLRQRLAAEPDNIPIRLELARLYEQQGFPDVALEHCRLLATRFPDDPDVRAQLARSLRQAGLPRQAIAELEGYARLHPDCPAAIHSWLGILRDELGEWKKAEEAHRAALALSPKADYLYNNLGYNLLLQGRNEEAAAALRQALELNPQLERARVNLGLALAGDPKEAVRQWRSVTDPATAHSNLAAVLIEKGRYQEAHQALEIALGYQRDHAAALRNLGVLAELDGRPVRAPVQPAASWWQRLGRAIIGAEPKPADGVAVTASR